MEYFFGALIFILIAFFGTMGVAVWGVSRGVKALGGFIRELVGRKTPELDDPNHTSTKRVQAKHPTASQGQARQATAAQGQTHPNATGHASVSGASASQTSTQKRRDYQHLDPDGGATPERIAEVLQPYVHDRVIGFYANEVITVLNRATYRRGQLFSELDATFEKGSLSWSRFAEPASEALDTIAHNSALLGNRIQAFDVDEYEQMERFYRSGGFSVNGNQDAARLERWRLIDATKREMDGLRAANDKLLLEVDKLIAELGKLSSDESSDESARIADEVSRLVDETKYYK